MIQLQDLFQVQRLVNIVIRSRQNHDLAKGVQRHPYILQNLFCFVYQNSTMHQTQMAQHSWTTIEKHVHIVANTSPRLSRQHQIGTYLVGFTRSIVKRHTIGTHQLFDLLYILVAQTRALFFQLFHLGHAFHCHVGPIRIRQFLFCGFA